MVARHPKDLIDYTKHVIR